MHYTYVIFILVVLIEKQKTHDIFLELTILSNIINICETKIIRLRIPCY